MGDILEQLRRLWRELGTNQKVSLALAVFAIVGVCIALMVWASRPRLQLLYGGMDPKEMAEVTQSIEAAGAKYEIRNGGSSIYVSASEVHSLRMRLASEGIPTGGGVGYEIFDSGSFGISSFVQHTNFVRAVQGELSRTINQLNGVRSSRVMIVIPENELLLTGTEKKPTASVFVDTGGKTLPLEAVDSIRSLVSNAVEGMNVNDVAVVDNRGNVLSAALKDDGNMGMTSSQIKYRKGLEDYYTGKVESMLARVLGAENVVVRVSVGLNMDMQTLVEEQFDPDSQVARRENSQENQVVSTESSRPRVAGEESNVGGGTQNPERDNVLSNTNETRKTTDRTFEINRTTIETVKNPGQISDLTASVFVATPVVSNGQGTMEPQPRNEEELNAIRMMVVNALGITYENDEELQRKVTLQEMPFAPNALSEGMGGESPFSLPVFMDSMRGVLAIVVSIVMLLIFFRMIRGAASSGDRMEVFPSEDGFNGGIDGALSKAKDVTPTISPELLNELIKQNPDKISSALKNWAFPGQ